MVQVIEGKIIIEMVWRLNKNDFELTRGSSMKGSSYRG